MRGAECDDLFYQETSELTRARIAALAFNRMTLMRDGRHKSMKHRQCHHHRSGNGHGGNHHVELNRQSSKAVLL
jgi:hypothetical protein